MDTGSWSNAHISCQKSSPEPRRRLDLHVNVFTGRDISVFHDVRIGHASIVWLTALSHQSIFLSKIYTKCVATCLIMLVLCICPRGANDENAHCNNDDDDNARSIRNGLWRAAFPGKAQELTAYNKLFFSMGLIDMLVRKCTNNGVRCHVTMFQ